MKLYSKEYGEDRNHPPLVLLHGLLGSLVNWQRIARSLAHTRRVIVPDLRNHGRSPHDPDVSYEAMANDVLELLDDLGIPEAVLIGHSMGGKTAMVLALRHPERVERLGVVDIAPVAYSGRLAFLMDALLSLPLEQIDSRAHADLLLADSIPEKAVCDHMLQNLQRSEGGWRWRNNLQALRDGLDSISGFPEDAFVQPYTGKSCFIKGEHSDYIDQHGLARIQTLFPAFELMEIRGAGHWVYAEQPRLFLDAVDRFLTLQDS
ncbi:alpha/beta fold hydrolase [Thiolapillus sp.]